MQRNLVEAALATAVVATLVAAVVVPLRVEAARRRARAVELRTIDLTGVMGQGLWAEEVVTAAAAWRTDFRRAQPVLRVGETVRLRLASADVVHAFAAPKLGVERVEVYPGEIVEVLVTPREVGVFEYYCTTVCGEAHFAMRGFFEVVEDPSVEPPPPPARPGRAYWSEAAPPPGADKITRGASLYRRQGCVTCHGETGVGGVPNPNSMNALVPPLAKLSRRTFLFTGADVGAFLAVLDERAPLEKVNEASAVPLFSAVKNQYLATRRLVRDGRRSVRLDPDGPRPPLDMPAWGARLSDQEIDAILAYLLTLGEGTVAAPAPGPTQTPLKGDLL